MDRQAIAPGVFTLSSFFSLEECRSWIQISESMGYQMAGVGEKQRVMTQIRNNERLLYDSVDLAEELWERLVDFVPAKIENMKAVGLNERFRFYKYKPEQRFKSHIDGSFYRNEQEKSLLTFMVYLNEDMEGGATRFKAHTVVPETGKALLFRHEIRHEGTKVVEGVKYVLRSDVMYRLVEE
ncbi:MAG: 2OG-Fe(II) oxygenase [Bacteroidota bacterium]